MASSEQPPLVCCVTGGRHYGDLYAVRQALVTMSPEWLFVGDASGADALALRAAKWLGIKFQVFKADWAQYGKAAGPIRNREMLQQALALGKDSTTLLAFPGGAGTANCIRQAKLLSIQVETMP